MVVPYVHRLCPQRTFTSPLPKPVAADVIGMNAFTGDRFGSAAAREHMHGRSPLLAVLVAVLVCGRALGNPPVGERTASSALSAVSADILSQRLDHEGIAGTLVICGGGSLADAGKQAFAAAVPAGTSVVVIPTASADPDAAVASARRWLDAAGVAEVITVDRTGDRVADRKSLSKRLRTAGGAWISGGRQSRLATAYAGTDVERELQALLKRGGVIGGTSAGAAIMSRVMIASGAERPRISSGLDLLPGAIIDQHFSQRMRIGRLRIAVAEHPDCFGLGVDEATSVVIQGRSVQVLGEGTATIVLAQASQRDAIEQVVPAGAVADLTQLRRAARWRCADVDPGDPCFGPPEVAAGSLVIVGGGGMSQPIVDRFIELAGGSQARIVVLPTAVSRREAFRSRVPGFLARAQVASVTLLPQSRTDEIAQERFQQTLREATGIWFDGGRQWNFVDAYENTAAIELFHDVLKRGGVIGGSSAGATIQGEYLVRGHPLGNTVMMAEGYERGFAFLPGVAIDQHFSQRRRQSDLIPVIQRYPRLLGIGIDEATALIVSGSRAEVLGEHAVHFLSNPFPGQQQPADASGGSDHPAASADEADRPVQPLTAENYLVVPAGKTIDLRTLQL